MDGPGVEAVGAGCRFRSVDHLPWVTSIRPVRIRARVFRTMRLRIGYARMLGVKETFYVVTTEILLNRLHLFLKGLDIPLHSRNGG